MDIAAEQNRHKSGTELTARYSGTAARFFFRGVLAFAAMALAANAFLKYLWWTACYSAWSGIPRMAARWRIAGVRSSFYGWAVIALEAASIALFYTAIRLRQLNPPFVRTALRAIASVSITLIGTGLLALALSWIKQSH